MITLSNQIQQEHSLQLSTSIALDQGVEDIHMLSKEYADKTQHPAFLKEVKKLFYKNNRKSFFFRGMPTDNLLKSNPALTEKVLQYAIKRHNGEIRDSGFPVIAHALSVGFLLTRLGIPPYIIYAGLLHDAVEDAPDKLKILNELHKLNPAVAWYVWSVSGTDTQDAVEKDQMLLQKINSHAELAGNTFPKAIKTADGIANVFDVEFMQGKDGRTAKERQLRFLENLHAKIIPFAREVDQEASIQVQKKGERFSLEEYARETIDFKKQLIEGS